MLSSSQFVPPNTVNDKVIYLPNTKPSHLDFVHGACPQRDEFSLIYVNFVKYIGYITVLQRPMYLPMLCMRYRLSIT